jgi:hypothetical protein
VDGPELEGGREEARVGRLARIEIEVEVETGCLRAGGEGLMDGMGSGGTVKDWGCVDLVCMSMGKDEIQASRKG